MAAFQGDFEKYVDFAESLEKDLTAIHGQAKARRLYTRMNRTQFQAFCGAASADLLKRRWLRKTCAGYENALFDSQGSLASSLSPNAFLMQKLI